MCILWAEVFALEKRERQNNFLMISAAALIVMTAIWCMWMMFADDGTNPMGENAVLVMAQTGGKEHG